MPNSKSRCRLLHFTRQKSELEDQTCNPQTQKFNKHLREIRELRDNNKYLQVFKILAPPLKIFSLYYAPQIRILSLSSNSLDKFSP